MLAFVSLRSPRLAPGVMLLGIVGAIVAFGCGSGPRSSATRSARSASTRPSTPSRPPPKSLQTAPGPRRGLDRIEGPYGRGGGQVWVVVPDRPLRSVVIFGHGWKLAPPSPTYSWVSQFRPWLDHLAASGSAVIFPRYQLGAGDPQNATRTGFRHRYPHRLRAAGTTEGASRGGRLLLRCEPRFLLQRARARVAASAPRRGARCLPQRHNPGRAVSTTQPIRSGADSSRGCRYRGRQRGSRRILALARDAPEFAQALPGRPLLAPTRRHPRRPQVSQCGCPAHVLGSA
jgi:hypothetical protein